MTTLMTTYLGLEIPKQRHTGLGGSGVDMDWESASLLKEPDGVNQD